MLIGAALSGTPTVRAIVGTALSGVVATETPKIHGAALSGTATQTKLLATARSGSAIASAEWLRAFDNPGTGLSNPSPSVSSDNTYPLDGKDYTVSAEDCIMPETEIRCSFVGSDMTQYLRGYQLSGSDEGNVSGTLEFLDYTGHLVDLVSNFKEGNANMRAHDMTKSRYYELVARQAGRGPKYPLLLPGDPTWDGTITRVPVTDFTPLINLDNQSITDVLYDEGDRFTAHDVIGQLMAKATGIQYVTNFPDYQIRDFRFANGNLINGIDDILQIRQAYRKWVGGRLHFEVLKEKSAVCHFQDRFHIPQEGWSHGTNVDGAKTFFKAFRLAPMPTALGGPITGEEVGRVINIQFARPSKFAIIWYRSQFGGVKNGVFFDANDNPLNSNPSFIHTGPEEAVRWEGTFEPIFSMTGGAAYFWWVQAMGGVNPDNGGGDFEVDEAVAAVEAVYGRRPEFSNLSSEIILDESTAREYLGAIAKEVEWSIRRFSLSTPMLAPAREGDFIKCTHYRTGIDEDLLLKNWNHSYSWTDGWSNSYGLAGRFM